MAANYRPIDLEEAVGEYRRCIHAAHILFWTEDYNEDPEVTYGLMQMRSDGSFGFPGGKSDEKIVDKNEIIQALCRELFEEVNFLSVKGLITLSDRVSSHLSIKGGKVLHFFAKELPLATFQQLEKSHMNARDFPKESLGLIRIPLKATGLSSYKPVRKFFANFGKQHFAGNARNQLIETITKLDLIGERDRKFFVKKMSI